MNDNINEKPEFKIGDIITLDRYNHIDDVQKSKIIGYTTIGWHENERLAYEIDVNGLTIVSTGISIMESKLYDPAPKEDRHHRLNATPIEIEDYWYMKRYNKSFIK